MFVIHWQLWSVLTISFIASIGGCVTKPPPEPLSEKAIELREQSEETRFTRLRAIMVHNQLQGRDIHDPLVLKAMLRVRRHRFVPQSILDSAYDDNALPLSLGQTISQPYIVALMTQMLGLQGTEKVLEIGTGSGYQAAVLAEIAQQVYTIEILRELSENAQRILSSLDYDNIQFRIGDGYRGWPEAAPFDGILVTAAPEHVPESLLEQLKIGGKMVIPVGRFDQELLLIEKTEYGFIRNPSIPVRFVPMTGEAQK